MERLGQNRGGYHGERIDIDAVVRDCAAAAREHRWNVEELAAGPGTTLLALCRAMPGARRSVYLSAGIHGDEPAGPLAARELLRENRWPVDANIWFCPCLNPWGFEHNSRNSLQGVDLNRDYRHLESAEVRAHVAWLERQPQFDLTVCLHEDWEAHGFYVYELRADDRPRLAPRVVAAVAAVCPIDHSGEIDGRPAQGGMIHPSADIEARPQWPEAVYLFRHHSRHCLTLEAPSDFPMATRVAALLAGARSVLES